MAQAKKKTATKTAKKSTCCAKKKTQKRSGMRCEKYQRNQKSNMFFVVCMSFLVATLLFANLILINT